MSDKKKPLIPNKVFSWAAIGIIIYVLFFQKSELPNGTKVSGFDHILNQSKDSGTIFGAVAGGQPGAGGQPVENTATSPSEVLPPGTPPTYTPENPAVVSSPFSSHPMQPTPTTQPKPNSNFSLIDMLQLVAGVVSRDVTVGTGEPVLCGQKVKVHYREKIDEREIYATINTTADFTVGDHDVLQGLETGIIGMKKGGRRVLVIPPKLAHDDPKFKREDVKENSKVDINVELVEYIPSYKVPSKGMGLKIYDDHEAPGDTAYCGNTATVNYKIWDMDGKLLASSFVEDPEATSKDKKKEEPGKAKFNEPIAQPMIFRLGGGEAPYVFDIAVTGNGIKKAMKLGGKRTLIVPAHFLKTMDGKASALVDKKLPEKTVLLEIELVSLSD